MVEVKKVTAGTLALLLMLGTALTAHGQAVNKGAKREEGFDPVEFLKRFKVGMSYTEVQKALPRGYEQDILSYIVTEDVFVLGVDVPTASSWSASFRFDTLDTPMRRPEQLIEISCGATLSSRSDTFESIVNKVTAAFGEPVKVDQTPGRMQQAGWRVSGGSLLTLEYSLVPSALDGKDVSVDFIIKRNRRRDTPMPRAIA